MSFDLEVMMILPNPNININIKRFDDRKRQRKLAIFFKQHRGSNVSIKELLRKGLLCSANIELLRQIKAYIHNKLTERFYVHGYIIKKINTTFGNLLIVLIRLKKVDTGETFTLYPDGFLPMIKFVVDDIDKYIHGELPDRFHHFDLEGLDRISTRINDQLLFNGISTSVTGGLNVITIMFVLKATLVHKLYPNYSNLFHTEI